LLAGAALLQATAWFGLRLLSVSTLERLLVGLAAPRRTRRAVGPADEARIVWVTQVMQRHFPPARNCLVQALVAHALLRRYGRPAHVRFGVATGDRFQAHAWVESQGRVIVGGPAHEQFTPLVDRTGRRA
jgi:Transglutaminase-like superfamily